MRRTTTRRPPATSGRDQHRAWLQLVDTEGPYVALPALLSVWPQGMPPLEAAPRQTLVDAKRAFDRAWDRWDAEPSERTSAQTTTQPRVQAGNRTAASLQSPQGVNFVGAQANADVVSPGLRAFRVARDAWVKTILRDVIGWRELWVLDDPAAVAAGVTSPTGEVTATPTGALRRGDHVAALVWVIDPVAGLRDLVDDGWASTPIDRMETMLRRSGIPIGVVTDGRWWGLVSAADKVLAASGVIDAQTWVEEPDAVAAFASLLSQRCLLGGQEAHRLPRLFADSVLAAEEITESLGVQVRQAVELVVQAMSEAARDAVGRGDPDPLPADGGVIYDAVVTVLMRVVFLLFAQERGLLPQGQLFELGYGLSGQLDVLDERARHEGEESLDATHLTWHRLLATSRALYQGASFEDLRLPAYGGSLFDPERFGFLTATTERGTLALEVSDRVMLHVLRALQTARVKGQDARRISFRDIDVEQIGYIYEGLLGYTCHRSHELLLGLIGGAGNEPEIPLDTLDDLFEVHGTDAGTAEAVLAWAKEHQPASKPPSKAALTKAFASGDTMEDAERALLAVSRDEGVRERLRPWIGAIRRDLRGRPLVIHPGGLVVVETPSRRNAGAHYTPRALAEEVVLYALQPLVFSPGPHQSDDSTTWVPLSSTDLLDLKVADIACGSGAFLVAAARYLAARLVEAWRREGLATQPSAALETKALRAVVAHCLYGADINPMAVEMCKLSLWLVSLDPHQPFSFVDDKVLCGNSLLGLTSLKQLEALHIAPPTAPQQTRFELSGDALVERLDLDHRIQRAIRLREQLASEIEELDPQRSAKAKAAQMRQLTEVTADLRLVADGVVAAGLVLGGKPSKALDAAYDALRVTVGRALPTNPAQADRRPLDAIVDRGLTPTVSTDYDRWHPLHWCLEVPDVIARGGFNAVVGNPPFLGGKKVSGASGSNLREWLVNVLAEGATGNADLVAYFFLRAAALLAKNGTMGLIATNTVAQGDTREVGLDRMVDRGTTITRAIQSRSWPAKSANLEFAAVWGTTGPVPDSLRRVSDDVRVRRISTLLEPAGRIGGSPARLGENRGVAFIGANVNCVEEFTMGPRVAHEMRQADPRLATIVRPFLVGEDLNSSPTGTASRWIVDFREVPDEKVPSQGLAFAWVEQRVKPARQRLTQKPALQLRWWAFERLALAMQVAIASLDQVLALALVSRTVMPMRVPTGQVFSHALGIFATDSYGDQAVLSSSLHQTWAIKYGSGMRNDPRYTPSDVFETFPRPGLTDALDLIGLTLDEERREMMVRRDFGPTNLYNRVNDADVHDSVDADVARLRQIHVDLDQAVMDAYGWGDVALDHGFHTYRQMERWTVSPAARVEILDRLLEENHRRAALQGEAPRSARHDDDDDGLAEVEPGDLIGDPTNGEGER